MNILDEKKQKIIATVNNINEYIVPEGFKLQKDTIVIHFPKVDEVPFKSHFEITRVYENGGKDLVEVIDEPGVEGVEEHDEYVDVFILVPKSDEEIKEEKEKTFKQTEFEKIIEFVQNNLTLEDFKKIFAK